MTGNGGWDDERLAAAYRGLVAGPVPADLAQRAIGGARVQPPRGRAFRSARTETRGLAALLGVAAVLAIVVGGLYVRGSGPVAESPRASRGVAGLPLPVMTVSEALAARDRGAFDDPATLVAIGGWLAPTLPAMGPPVPTHPPLERDQHSTPYFLTEVRQKLVESGADGSMSWARGIDPSGPSIAPRLLDGFAWLPVNGGTQDGYEPVEAVLVGHFHDGRAADCSAEQRTQCENEFVLDQVASIDGRALGPNVWIGADEAGATLKPALSPEEVAAVLAPYLARSDTIVSFAAARLMSIYDMRLPGGASGNGNSVFWFVRVAGPAPKFPMDFRGGDSGWFVVGDRTRVVHAMGGWGFVPGGLAVAASPGPVRRYPSGEYVIPTSTSLDVATACAGVGLDAILHGNPSDPRLVWLENRLGAGQPDAVPRLEIVWPAGYRARFGPKLEILNAQGQVVLREGDPIEGACGTFENGVYLTPPWR